MYYSAIGMLAILILLIENQDILRNRKGAFEKPAWQVYRRFLFAVLIYYVSDVLWGVIESLKVGWLLFADTTVYFVAVAVGVHFWVRYTVTYLNDNNKFGRILVYAGRILAGLIALLAVVNIFVPILFTVDEACVYTALPVRYAALACQILLLLLISVFAFLPMLQKEGGSNGQKGRALGFFGLIMAFFLFLQLWFPYLPLYSIAYMLGTCLLHTIVLNVEKEEYRLGMEEAVEVGKLKDTIVSLLDHMPGITFTKDAESGVYLACNQAFAEFASKDDPSGVTGLTDAQLFDEEMARHFAEDDRTALSMDKPYVFFEDVTDAEGNQRQLQTTKLKYTDINGRLCVLCMSRDVTDKASRFDYLTGLPNMAEFVAAAEDAKELLKEIGCQSVLLYINLVGMKHYNHRFGFAEGDRYLQDFADLLSSTFGSENCCRFGQDHFGVAMKDDHIEKVIEQLFRANEALDGGGGLPIHIGIYPTRLEDVPVATACDRAKLACDAIRDTFQSGFRYYSSNLREEALRHQYILDKFEQAIAEKWIQVYYQPIVRAANNKVCDEEALARWIDPSKGILSPADFIPVLEDEGLIYKLDLYVLEQVLEKIKLHIQNGQNVVPHSVNLSRSDFTSCDIVEEFCIRVDAAGVSRDLITIEITESIIGTDFDFMKKQVERFRAQGFRVWMDDFGSGYSSMDVLESMKFDLLKFDMSFMRKLHEGDGRIILTKLVELATSLCIDTVCEGVETEEQVRFLQEIGCSKLQGYYYSKPVSLQTILERYGQGARIGYENREESPYYEAVGRVNLYDLSVAASDQDSALQRSFNTLPIAIAEVNGDLVRFIRSNQSYRDYLKRFFGMDMSDLEAGFTEKDNALMHNVVKACCEQGVRTFYDEKMPDGSLVHLFARWIGTNPVNGNTAVAIAVLSITDENEGATYAGIARALASDYYNIYYIDLETENFIEYTSSVGTEALAVERHGEQFFDSVKQAVETRIYEGDRETFLTLFSRENILHELDEQGVFTLTYRLMDSGAPVYANMKITRMQGNHLIMGISIIDAQMKQQEEAERLQQEKIALGRLAALSPDYIVLYTVDLETGHYMQFNPSNEFSGFGLAQQGTDFFADVKRDAPKAIDPEDMERHLRVFTKENILRDIQKNGFFIHNYRLLMDGRSVPVSLKATLVEGDDGGKRILLGVAHDEREETRRRLEEAYEEARNNSIIFTHIAQALARGYTDLYYVNMDTDALIEYHTDDERGVLTEARRSMDFFEGCKRDVKLFVHPDDQEAFVKAMDRDYLTNELKKSKVFEIVYRRIKDGRTFYVRMRISRVEDDPRYVVIAVRDIDELIQKRRIEEQIAEERIIYARLHALTGNFICIYVVDPETNHYREFSATSDYEANFAQAKEGTDFFNTVRDVAQDFNDPADLPKFLSAFTKENVLSEIERSGSFTLGYRVVMEGRSVHVQMKAALVEEKEGKRLIVGLNNVDTQFRQEEEMEKQLEKARFETSTDALTGVKNKHAYMEAEEALDRQIAKRSQPPFAVVIMDVNDLKMVNDTEGHQAGDQYLRDASKVICEVFKHSPVFRFGGDEFAVIAQGKDYELIEDRLENIQAHNKEALRSGGVVIACGMAKYEGEGCTADVFKRADHMMYENKTRLKTKNSRL